MTKHFDLHQTIQQDQRMIMSAAMEQAFHVLMLPSEELTQFVMQEIEKNPILQLPTSSAAPLDTSLIPSKPTLYEHLLAEIPLYFSQEEDRAVASTFAGSLDPNGFLTLTHEEIKGKEKVLHCFQRMEPKGIGARSAQEALLIQLEENKTTPLYILVSKHYDDLLHLRLPKIAKQLKISLDTVKELIINHLRLLNPYPGRGFTESINPTLIPDLAIIEEEGIFRIEVCDGSLPSIEIHPNYLTLLEQEGTPSEDTAFIRRHLASGKWLKRTLDRRKKTLQEIATYLLKTQQNFFKGLDDAPTPLTMKEVAKQLSLSESTITRAISQKVIATPRGLIPLRDFFKKGLPAKELLATLIEKETTPLSDEALSALMKENGFPCARRTVAKYRKELKIGSASERKLKL